jgi:hypothetical protein
VGGASSIHYLVENDGELNNAIAMIGIDIGKNSFHVEPSAIARSTQRWTIWYLEQCLAPTLSPAEIVSIG